MNPENQQWQETKENYLKQIEKSLAQVDQPQRADILKDNWKQGFHWPPPNRRSSRPMVTRAELFRQINCRDETMNASYTRTGIHPESITADMV
jgi:hypothetical protein